jgi:hypothetical protein
MIISTTNTSPKIYASVAGALYLINIIFGFFAIAYVEGKIVVDNSAATVNNIVRYEFLYRLGILAHIIILLTNVPLALIFYRLFRIVNKNATLLVIFFTLIGTAIEASNLLNQFEPLVLLKYGMQPGGSGSIQINDWVVAFLRLKTTGFNLALVFFGFYGISIGFLIYNSTFLPKLIGVFLTVGGACYVVYSFSNFLVPKFSTQLVPYLQIASGLAELSFCIWLLLVGVNVKKWREKEKWHQSKAYAQQSVLQ